MKGTSWVVKPAFTRSSTSRLRRGPQTGQLHCLHAAYSFLSRPDIPKIPDRKGTFAHSASLLASLIVLIRSSKKDPPFSCAASALPSPAPPSASLLRAFGAARSLRACQARCPLPGGSPRPLRGSVYGVLRNLIQSGNLEKKGNLNIHIKSRPGDSPSLAQRAC